MNRALPDQLFRPPAASRSPGATLRDVAAWLLLAASAVVGGATLLGFAGRWWWRAELASHFRVQYLLVLAAATVILVLLGRRWQACLSGLLTGTNLLLVLPLYWAIAPPPGGEPSGELVPLAGATLPYGRRAPAHERTSSEHVPPSSMPLRAVTMNVHTFNHQHQRALDFVHKESPDFVLMLEVGRAWAAALEVLQAEYPYHRVEPREDHFGIALYSRLEPESLRVRALVWPEFPCLIAELTIDGQALSIIGAHPVPPIHPASMAHRNHQLADLAGLVQRQQGEVVLLGDLNTTSWSPYFVDLVRESGLRDSRRGFGVQGTWPVGSPWLEIPIDHCLVSPGIEVVDRRVGPDIGSDHYPVVVDFRLRQSSLAVRHRGDVVRASADGG